MNYLMTTNEEKFKRLEGHKIKEIIHSIRKENGKDGDLLILRCDDFNLWMQPNDDHFSPCDCWITLESDDDLWRLIGDKVLEANIKIGETEEGARNPELKWTFYTIRTFNNTITFAWKGETNGYYSSECEIEVENKLGLQ